MIFCLTKKNNNIFRIIKKFVKKLNYSKIKMNLNKNLKIKRKKSNNCKNKYN